MTIFITITITFWYLNKNLSETTEIIFMYKIFLDRFLKIMFIK